MVIESSHLRANQMRGECQKTLSERRCIFVCLGLRSCSPPLFFAPTSPATCSARLLPPRRLPAPGRIFHVVFAVVVVLSPFCVMFVYDPPINPALVLFSRSFVLVLDPLRLCSCPTLRSSACPLLAAHLDFPPCPLHGCPPRPPPEKRPTRHGGCRRVRPPPGTRASSMPGRGKPPPPLVP